MTRARFYLISALATLTLAACADDEAGLPFAEDTGRDAILDGGSDAAHDVIADADAGQDATPDVADAAPDSTPDVADAAPDVRDPDAFNEDTLEPPPPPPERPDDWHCDREARVADCDSPLLDLAERPTDGNDLLFYVNRAEALPDTYPIPAGSTWDACSGSPDPGGDHDLVCIPAEYNSGPRRSLRQIAWHSPAPADYTTTHDGRPVGYRGHIGFLAMFQAARAEADIDLFVVSGFRSHATQHGLHEGYVAREMSGGLSEEEARYAAATYSARPGHSEHQLGTTADITFRREDGTIFQGLSAAMGASRSFQWVFRNAHRFGIALTYGEHRVEVTQYVYEPWHYRFVGVEAADEIHRCSLNTEEALAARYGAGPLPPWGGEHYTLWTDATLIDHVTLPPGSWIATGATVTKTWRVRNTGSINWWNFGVLQVEGPALSEDSPSLSCVLVGGDAEISVDVTMPETAGLVEAAWAIFDTEGVSFGEELPLLVETSPIGTGEAGQRFVRVVDVSYADATTDPGADIDAVVVTGPGGERYAAQVVRYAPSVPVGSSDASATLGPPDAFDTWPSVETCRVDGGFASLGGSGELIVRFNELLAAGDQIAVLEVGGCEYDAGRSAIPDEFEIYVGSAPDGPWMLVGDGIGPVGRAVVP